MLSKYRSVLSRTGRRDACSPPRWWRGCRRAWRRSPSCCSSATRRIPTPPRALAVGASAFATAGCAPLLGRLVDGCGRGRVLAAAGRRPRPCSTALLVVAAQAHAGAAPLIVLAALSGALLPPVAPVVRVLLGEVFDDPRRARDRLRARGGHPGGAVDLRAPGRGPARRGQLRRRRGGAARRGLPGRAPPCSCARRCSIRRAGRRPTGRTEHRLAARPWPALSCGRCSARWR